MKKIFLIFVAMVMLSSVAFADKSRFYEGGKVMLVRRQTESQDGLYDEADIEKSDITYAFVYSDESFVTMYSDWNKPVDAFNWGYCARLRVTDGNECEYIEVEKDGSENLRYSIAFAPENTVFVTKPSVKKTFDQLRETYGSYPKYEADTFVLEAESYSKLKTDLLEKHSLESAISFLANGLYFWNNDIFYEILSSRGESYRIKSAVCRFPSYCANFYELHIQYQYENGVLSSMIAEDKGDYGGTIYKKTLVSDNQAERVYSAEINDFYEVSSLATETFDKQKQIWHCEGEWFANRVSKNTETRFPPKIVYLSESKIKDFLSGKILVGE